VKTNPGLPVGTAISNTAYIYFDYNPAVVTNTTINTVTNFTKLPEHDAASITLYPNPASKQLTLSFQNINSENLVLEVYDIYGHCVKEIKLSEINTASFHHNLDISEFSSGVYFIKIQGSVNDVKKFVKI
jgi:hypothetical protein